MEPISNADRLVAMLRLKLQERAKSTAATAGRKSERRTQAPEPAGMRALAALDGVDDHQLRRSFIQTLLADQLGPSLVNDGQFQQIVTRVTDAIEADPDASRLVARLLVDLRKA